MEVPDELLPPYLPKYYKEIMDFYDKVKTQWRVTSDINGAALVGLDYLAVAKTAKIYKFKLDSFRMDVLREIESFIRNKENVK